LQKVFGMFNNGLTKVEDWFASVSGGIVGFMMVLTVAGVIGRAAHKPIKGEVEVITFIILWVVMLSISYALRQGEHLAVGIVFDRLSPGAKRIVNIVVIFIGLFIVFMLVWSTAMNTGWAISAWDTYVGAIQMPTWWSRLAMPIGIGLAFPRLVVLLVQTLRGEG